MTAPSKSPLSTPSPSPPNSPQSPAGVSSAVGQGKQFFLVHLMHSDHSPTLRPSDPLQILSPSEGEPDLLGAFVPLLSAYPLELSLDEAVASASPALLIEQLGSPALALALSLPSRPQASAGHVVPSAWRLPAGARCQPDRVGLARGGLCGAAAGTGAQLAEPAGGRPQFRATDACGGGSQCPPLEAAAAHTRFLNKVNHSAVAGAVARSGIVLTPSQLILF